MSVNFPDPIRGSDAETVLRKVEALLAAKQPLDSDLTAIAALTTTSYGRALLEKADAAAVRAVLGETAWVAPTLSANWSNFGGTFAEAAYRKVGDNVQIRGLVKKSIAGVSGETIFTLPAGFRPPADLTFVTVRSSEAIGRVDVLTTGVVAWTGGIPTTYFSLSLPLFSITA